MTKKAYLQAVLCEIKGTFTRKQIEKELTSHIEEQIACAVSAGIEPAAAEEEAVRRMGDAKAVGREMERLWHPLHRVLMNGLLAALQICFLSLYLFLCLFGKAALSEGDVLTESLFLLIICLSLALTVRFRNRFLAGVSACTTLIYLLAGFLRGARCSAVLLSLCYLFTGGADAYGTVLSHDYYGTPLLSFLSAIPFTLLLCAEILCFFHRKRSAGKSRNELLSHARKLQRHFIRITACAAILALSFSAYCSKQHASQPLPLPKSLGAEESYATARRLTVYQAHSKSPLQADAVSCEIDYDWNVILLHEAGKTTECVKIREPFDCFTDIAADVIEITLPITAEYVAVVPVYELTESGETGLKDGGEFRDEAQLSWKKAVPGTVIQGTFRYDSTALRYEITLTE